MHVCIYACMYMYVVFLRLYDTFGTGENVGG